MPTRCSDRAPADHDLAMRLLQVDRSCYESYWLEEPKRQPAGMIARNVTTAASCLRPAWDRLASVRRAVLAIVLTTKTSPGIRQSWICISSPRRGRSYAMFSAHHSS